MAKEKKAEPVKAQDKKIESKKDLAPGQGAEQPGHSIKPGSNAENQ